MVSEWVAQVNSGSVPTIFGIIYKMFLKNVFQSFLVNTKVYLKLFCNYLMLIMHEFIIIEKDFGDKFKIS